MLEFLSSIFIKFNLVSLYNFLIAPLKNHQYRHLKNYRKNITRSINKSPTWFFHLHSFVFILAVCTKLSSHLLYSRLMTTCENWKNNNWKLSLFLFTQLLKEKKMKSELFTRHPVSFTKDFSVKRVVNKKIFREEKYRGNNKKEKSFTVAFS